jgi:hypothetical protein
MYIDIYMYIYMYRNSKVIVKEEMKANIDDFDIDTESVASSKDLSSTQVRYVYKYMYLCISDVNIDSLI